MSDGFAVLREEARERMEYRSRRDEGALPVSCDCGRIQVPGERFKIGPFGIPICPECNDYMESEAWD